METIELSYKGMLVPFRKGDKVFQKITPVLNAYGEIAAHYFASKERFKYFESLAKHNELTINKDRNSDVYNLNSSVFAKAFPDLVKTERGKYGGTWISQEVIMDFARWLSPDFAVWCDQKIKELLQQGHTELKPEDYSEVQVIKRIADVLVEQEKKMKSQDKKIQALEEHIGKLTEERQVRNDYCSVMAYAYLKNIHINHDKAVEIGEKAKDKCKEQRIAVDNYINNEYGKVWVYPKSVLKEVFVEMFND